MIVVNKEPVDVVTRADRGIEWLDRCYESLIPLKIKWTWHIVVRPGFIVDARNRGYERTVVHLAPNHPTVHEALCGVNQYLANVPNVGQWFFNLDDDNLMHPNFDNLEETMSVNDIVFFSQQVTPTSARLIVPERFSPGCIDMAQFVARRTAMGRLKFWEVYRGDSYYIQELTLRAQGGMGLQPQRVAYFYGVASYYNAQRYPFTDRP
jgi:hypothetical protein